MMRNVPIVAMLLAAGAPATGPATGIAAPVPAPKLGPDSVWSGKELEACRPGPAADGDACLIATMKRTGATPAALAFAQRTVAGKDGGYVSAWKQAGPVGIATIAYPFRADPGSGTMLVPVGGEPIDVDAYALTAADKARADYRAAQAQHPDASAVPPGEIAVDPVAESGIRIRVTTPTADCRACAPNGSIVIGYDFDAAGHFLHAGLLLVA